MSAATWSASTGPRRRRLDPAPAGAPRGQRAPLARAADAATSALDQATSVLITYGDQVRAPGEPPLRTLRRLLDGPLAGTTSAVHLLPFYPATSDDGFSVADYLAVDPAVGAGTTSPPSAAGRPDVRRGDQPHLGRAPVVRGFLAGDPRYADWYVTADPDADLSATVRPRTTPLLTPFSGHDGVRHVWTTFSADQVDLDYRRPEVLAAVLDVLLTYVERGARLPAARRDHLPVEGAGHLLRAPAADARGHQADPHGPRGGRPPAWW
jgi:glucosylglycerate phosphorylase